jgi:hypothetical protein
VATLPLGVYVTRFSERYELLHSAAAIPVAALLGLASVALARRARRRNALTLARTGSGPAQAGRLLGILGLCMVASALVALAVYGLLEYAGARD